MMLRRTYYRLRILVLPLLISLLAATVTYGQPMPKVEPFGIDGFRLMLQQQGLEATQTGVGTALDNPTDTVLVLVGDLNAALSMRGQVQKFLREGGAALVATDAGGKVNQIAWPTSGSGTPSFRFTGSFSAKDENDAYHGHSDCPIVTQFDKTPAPELLSGVESVISNRPAKLVLSNNTKGIAWLPEAKPANRRAVPLMAVHNAPNAGRLLLVADHSVFINEMLIHGDNARFASNVASWLAEGGRSRLVVIQDGSVLPEWSFGDNPPAIPLKSLLQVVNQNGWWGLLDLLFNANGRQLANQSVGMFERQNGFNEMARLFGRGMAGNSPTRLVALMLAMGLLLLAARWLFFTRGRAQRWLFYQDSETEAETKLSSAISEKQYHPYLRTLAREFFADSGVTHFGEPDRPPEVTVQKTLGKSKITKEVKAFWSIATKTDSEKLSKRRFGKFIERLRELHHLQTDGVLKLE